jgi:integrase
MGTKRGNAEGTIRRRTTDGRWDARITLTDGRRKSFYGDTRAEVARRLSEALRDQGKGLPVVPERQTLGQYLQTWIEGMKGQIRASSYRRYGDHVRIHLVPGLGRIALARLTPQHVQLFYARMLAEGLSSTTVHHLHGVLHRALEDAERMGLVQRNVSEQVRSPRRSTAEMQTLSEAEAQQFLETVADDRFAALYVLALTTGMREGELLALCWQDVDLERATLSVRLNVQETPGGYVLAEPKTAYSRRSIALSATAIAALREHRVRQHEERLQLGPVWDATVDLIFPNTIGGIMFRHNLVRRSFKRHLTRAGLPESIRFHDLRHTAASHLLSRGVHPKVVSEMLGHADIAITLRVYAHVTPHMQQAAADVMDRIYGTRPA